MIERLYFDQLDPTPIATIIGSVQLLRVGYDPKKEMCYIDWEEIEKGSSLKGDTTKKQQAV